MKKIIITGATGSIGQKLVKELIAREIEVIIFTRNPDKAKNNLPGANKYVKWDYNKPKDWKEQLNGIDVVVHLRRCKPWCKAME